MDKFDKAARYALDAHKGMIRKRSNAPYILHPFEVASIAATMTVDEDVLCAALLHDVVEDTDCTLEELREEFGDRVATLVAYETEKSYPDESPQQSWERRKIESLEDLRACDDRDVFILWLSDKLSNMRSFARLHEQSGDDMWRFFHESNPERQAWYYQAVGEAVSTLSESAAWREYTHLFKLIFKGVD